MTSNNLQIKNNKSHASIALLRAVWRFRRLLGITSVLELKQRYAGSILGSVWVLLYPIMLLSIYLFLYLVIFKVRLPEMSELGYVVYVFTGLIPYLIIMESLTRGATIIKENIHLIKNVIMPVELVPVRLVYVSFLSQTASIILLLILIAITNDISWHIIFLPLVLALIAAFVIGIVFFVASFGVIFKDVGYIVNLLTIALLFLSPIAFKPEMVPATLQIVIYLNPISYPLEAIRWSLLDSHDANLIRLLVFPVLAILTFGLGASFFTRFKGLLADHV